VGAYRECSRREPRPARGRPGCARSRAGCPLGECRRGVGFQRRRPPERDRCGPDRPGSGAADAGRRSPPGMSRATVQHARARRAWSLASAAAIVAMIAVAVLGVLSRAGAQQDQREIAPDAAPAVRFLAFDIYVDSGATPLAAYQIEISASAPGDAVTLVGVEG